MSDIRGFLEWKVQRPKLSFDQKGLYPDSLFAACPHQFPTRLPFEVALLLPIQKVRDPVPDTLSNPAKIAAALFLANPLLNTQNWMRYLHRRGVGWIANFPSISQHEQSFQDRLTDVDMGFEKELSLLSEFRDFGFKILASAASARDAEAAVQAGCDALMVLPQIPAFEAGFPSVQNRQTQLQKIRSQIAAANVPILGLLQPAEAALISTWPTGMDAGMVRPTAPFVT